jgi:hypothetical protein
MGEAITIKKKKKLTIKSRSDAADAPVEEAPQGLVLPGLSPQAPAAAPSAPFSAYTFYAIFALLATLMFIGVVTVQWMEWTYLKPAFPLPISTGM